MLWGEFERSQTLNFLDFAMKQKHTCILNTMSWDDLFDALLRILANEQRAPNAR